MQTPAIIVKRFAVDILTPHYRVYGEIATRGDPIFFINDQAVATLAVHDATLMPLREGMRLGAMAINQLYIPKTEVHAIIFGNYIPETKPLPHRERLVCFTDTFIMRGTFHMSQETKPEDVFYVTHGPFFEMTNVEIYALYPLVADIRASAELGYIRGSAVRAFFQLEE